MKRIGILAYGSLIDDLGKEIEAAMADRIKDVETPFKVEFARSSITRDGAPTLVPIENGGANVKAQILVLKEGISEKDAKDMLWRRETRKVGSGKTYKPPPKPTENTVLVERLENLRDIEIVFHTRISANIEPLTPQRLAQLAIESALSEAGAERRDGISYLISAKRNGIKTPLMPKYEEEILKKAGAGSLEEAWSILQIDRLQQQAIEKMNSGDSESALNIARRIQNLGSHYTISYISSGLLIDIGAALGDEGITKEGVGLLRRDFREIIRDRKYAPTAYYNLANGYYALFRFRKMKDPFAACFKVTELDHSKTHYRKVLEYDLQDATFISQTHVNLGNCLDELGRVVDALECYDESIKWKPDHGMALGNKGQALLHYATLTGEHQGTFMIEAYTLLSRALKSGVPPEAVSTFSTYLEEIGEHFPDRQALENPPEFPGYKIKAESKFEKFLVEFCMKNKLYLNMCNFCQKCDAAIGDTIVIRKMIVETAKNRKEDPYLRLSSYLNQIKQDYVAARFLLVLPRYKGLNLDFVDRNVTIIDTFDYTRHNIYIQLVKTSFKNFYDILDKISCFINDYLELGIPERKIDFRKVWYSNQKTKVIRKKIEKTRNLSLSALYDIHRDFENGPYEELRKTRNALTHRFVSIGLFQEIEDEENMKEDTLVRQTLELARIVRSAIIYLLHFVHVEEEKKERKTRGTRVPLFAKEIPDSLKTREL